MIYILDKNWHCIPNEEVGLKIIEVIDNTKVCLMTDCQKNGFTLLHFAVKNECKDMTEKLLSLKVFIRYYPYE